MADPVTVNRGLAQATRGSDVGTWDLPLNGNFGILDTIVGGVTNIATTGGATTLNAAQLANGTITITGNKSTFANIVWPSVQGWWTVQNLTTDANVVFLQAGGITEQICAPPGEIVDIQVNGSVVRYRNLGRIGSYMDLATTSTPGWIGNCTIPPYLYCNGASFNASTYPVLNTLLGGNQLPDLRGRARYAFNDGTNRITAGVSGINGDALLSAGGDQNYQVHSHAVNGNTGNDTPPHNHQIQTGGGNFVAGTGSGGSGPSSPASVINPISIPPTTSNPNTNHTHPINLQSGNAGAGGSANMPPATIAGMTFIRAG